MTYSGDFVCRDKTKFVSTLLLGFWRSCRREGGVVIACWVFGCAFAYACSGAGGGRLLTRWGWVFANMFGKELCADYLLVVDGALLLLARVPT